MANKNHGFSTSFRMVLLIVGLTVFFIPDLSAQGVFQGPTWVNGQLQSVGLVDIHVLLDENSALTDAELFLLFNNISKELYDATEKQVQLGKVYVYRGGPIAKDRADILVSSVITRGYTYAGNFGQGGTYGKIYLNEGNLSSTRPVVVHEMGHLVFNMKDSYLGYLQNTTNPNNYAAPTAVGDGYYWRANSPHYWDSFTVPFPDTRNTFFDTTDWDTNSLACIMDGPWVGETEFSTPAGQGWATDHILAYIKDISWQTAPNGTVLDPPFQGTVVVVTKQNAQRNFQSTWETMVDFRPSMRLPVAEPTSNIDGHVDIALEVIPLVNELSVCIDRSGSMSGLPLNLAKQAASLVVDLAHEETTLTDPAGGRIVTIPGDLLSVTSFDTDSQLVFSDAGFVAEMTDPNKTAAKNAISNINLGELTSIGAGLIESRDTFLNTGLTPKSIILLSDGQENTPPYTSTVIQSLLDQSIRIYAIGLGPYADQNMLRNLADQTGGEFFYADNENQLPGIFATLYGNIRNDSFLEVEEGTIGDMENFDMVSSLYQDGVYVDSAVAEITFLATWSQGVGILELNDPDGIYISDQNYSSYPGASYVFGTGYALFRITEPKVGSWQILFTPDQVQGNEWEVKAFAVDDLTQLSGGTDQGLYIYPDPVIIRASCGAPQPVIGGSVTAEVTGPDGSIVTLDLLDNGDIVRRGDEFLNDGIYSGKFNAFSEDGVYTVTLKFDSSGGMTPSPINCTGIEFSIPEPGDLPMVPEPVEPFVRYRQFTFSISGIPDIIPAVVTINPETLNLKSKGNFVTAYIEMVSPYDVEDIIGTSIYLYDGNEIVAAAFSEKQTIDDFDLDGNPDLAVKFMRKEIIDYLNSHGITDNDIELTVFGWMLTGELFRGSSSIRIKY